MGLRINIGCEQTLTRSWRDFDNSLSVQLSKIPCLPELLLKLKIVHGSQYEFMRFARENDLEYADATRCLRVQDGSVGVLYSSHMLEHLDRNKANRFLKEASRVLRPGGIIRIVVPDLKKQVEQYNESGDADAFIQSTQLCMPRSSSVPHRLHLLLVGARNHQWMYDGNSLSRLLQSHGFVKTELMPAAQTKILDHEPLDLQERASESVCVEAEKPGA
jgi:predicted SAM-dependent methyltransferase